MSERRFIWPSTEVRRELTQAGVDLWKSPEGQALVATTPERLRSALAHYFNDRCEMVEIIKGLEVLRKDKTSTLTYWRGNTKEFEIHPLQKLKKDCYSRLRQAETRLGIGLTEVEKEMRSTIDEGDIKDSIYEDGER